MPFPLGGKNPPALSLWPPSPEEPWPKPDRSSLPTPEAPSYLGWISSALYLLLLQQKGYSVLQRNPEGRKEECQRPNPSEPRGAPSPFGSRPPKPYWKFGAGLACQDKGRSARPSPGLWGGSFLPLPGDGAAAPEEKARSRPALRRAFLSGLRGSGPAATPVRSPGFPWRLRRTSPASPAVPFRVSLFGARSWSSPAWIRRTVSASQPARSSAAAPWTWSWLERDEGAFRGRRSRAAEKRSQAEGGSRRIGAQNLRSRWASARRPLPCLPAPLRAPPVCGPGGSPAALQSDAKAPAVSCSEGERDPGREGDSRLLLSRQCGRERGDAGLLSTRETRSALERGPPRVRCQPFPSGRARLEY
ncbi:hypothetical protein JRQ81_017099 [Phrynocephalus forsythii]|uniref:Uncharacterized protein n=1 Tax=Phrynocephalus forsythii TaxID=171643 RepID=A0A9Q0XTL2_9SAUR|nr:hypothetical protein JRQ81_017099 [Phrynocephalus forsythii]